MHIINRTPFTPFVFEFQDQDKDDHFIVISRGTFRIQQGKPLIPCEDQLPIVTADEYVGKPLKTPMIRESDMCPVKLNTDIFVIGDAIAPGDGASSWDVAIQMGSQRSELRVYGPRSWLSLIHI